MKLLLRQALTLAIDFCSLAHPNQVMPCKGSYWLLSQTFPEVIGGVTSTLHVMPCKDSYWLLSQTFPEVIGGVTSTLHVMPCKGSYWLLSQTFPEVIGGVTSTLHVTSTMSFHPRKTVRGGVK
ncbi:hypothetical protein EYF80_007466 [Liparis tanakae]|uniref:Uncharacterized protein n=1 Tax=Liparis tanakae TaxID=230148 RepID=A0A4Z2IWK9_9TELE|nr:hypothetical protein EYF80_007466 [Liparis tanakae]